VQVYPWPGQNEHFKIILRKSILSQMQGKSNFQKTVSYEGGFYCINICHFMILFKMAGFDSPPTGGV